MLPLSDSLGVSAFLHLIAPLASVVKFAPIPLAVSSIFRGHGCGHNCACLVASPFSLPSFGTNTQHVLRKTRIFSGLPKTVLVDSAAQLARLSVPANGSVVEKVRYCPFSIQGECFRALVLV